MKFTVGHKLRITKPTGVSRTNENIFKALCKKFPNFREDNIVVIDVVSGAVPGEEPSDLYGSEVRRVIHLTSGFVLDARDVDHCNIDILFNKYDTARDENDTSAWVHPVKDDLDELAELTSGAARLRSIVEQINSRADRLDRLCKESAQLKAEIAELSDKLKGAM